MIIIRKLTQEFIENEFKNKGFKILNKYIDNKSVLFIKDKDGYIYITTWNKFNNRNTPHKFYITNPYTIYNIKLWMGTNAIQYELLSDEYKGSHENLSFRCSKNHEFEMEWHSFKQGNRCPYCCNKKVLQGYNDIYTTDRWMCDLGVSEEDARTHTRCSGEKVVVKCPDCGREKEIVISSIYNRKSISCPCGDGVSYPEKFMMYLLDQLEVRYKKEYKSQWSNKKRYDFYLYDYNVIIETHGIQHYEDNHLFSVKDIKTLEEEQENDRYKKELALNNGIDEYIILDCRASDLENIKNSILNSKLNNMFDLSNVNWVKCESFALGNRVKEVCDYWNQKEEWETTATLASKFNLDRHTIRRYLYKGFKLSWCVYNPKEELKIRTTKSGNMNKKLLSKPVEIFKDGKSLGVFSSCSELERQSEELFGVKLNHSKICMVCNGKRNQHKGFTFKYVDKQN